MLDLLQNVPLGSVITFRSTAFAYAIVVATKSAPAGFDNENPTQSDLDRTSKSGASLTETVSVD